MLDHLLISMIEKIGTPERYMAIAVHKRMDLVPISDWRMPSFCFSNCDYSVAAQIGNHLCDDIDDRVLVFHKSNWGVLVCSLV